MDHAPIFGAVNRPRAAVEPWHPRLIVIFSGGWCAIWFNRLSARALLYGSWGCDIVILCINVQ